MILDDIRETMEQARAELGAASCTFYVRDPFWPEELRLIAMPGVRLVEPMHGFSFPPHSKRVLAEGEPEIFSRDSRDTKQLREDAGTPLGRIASDRRFLFGDFIEREGIESSARLWRLTKDARGKERIEAVLFVNYGEAREFDDDLKAKIKGLLNRLGENLNEIHGELRASEMDAVVQAIQIFPPTYADSAAQPGERDQPLEEYLGSLLGQAMKALDLDADKTFGTVHLYDRRAETLNLAASRGNIEYLDEAAKPVSVPTGQGIISWVAIRRKAVLISDLESSEFKRIHIAISGGVRSEVAIPIFDGEALLGVLNLESSLPNAFSRTCVRSLWFAVNRAAEAVRLSQQVSTNKRLTKLISGLLELGAETVGGKGAGAFSLNQLADLAADELQAARCGIWRFNSKELRFELSGISPRDFKPDPPRLDGGWSGIIKDFGWLAWIERKEAGDFAARFWDENDWRQPPEDWKAPGEINASVGPDVKSLLGIPIKVRKKCIGIAWLEYESSPETHTEKELMKLASGFAAYAGLVIEFSQVDLVDKDAVQTIGDRLSEELLAPGRLALEGFPRIEVFVKSQPYGQSRIGGDYYAARVIDEQKTAGVLVGDAEGHAVQGALNMLPMLTVFEAFWKESRSVTHIMDKIMGTSQKLGVRGTAVYCVFTVIEEALWLSVTAAGHYPNEGAPLVIFPKDDGGAEPFPRRDSPARGSMLGVRLLKQPLAEARRRLSSGDLIIICTDGLDLDLKEVVAAGVRLTDKPPDEVAEAVFAAALDKRGGEPFEDDATVLVISVK